MSWNNKKKNNAEQLDLNGLPSSYFESASDIMEGSHGISKLRNRNDKIHSELSDLSKDNVGTKLVTFKVEDGDFIVYSVQGLEISVKLVNK